MQLSRITHRTFSKTSWICSRPKEWPLMALQGNQSWEKNSTNRVWMQVSTHISWIFNNHCTHSQFCISKIHCLLQSFHFFVSGDLFSCSEVIKLRQATLHCQFQKLVLIILIRSPWRHLWFFRKANSSVDLIKTLACNLILISGFVSIGQKQVSFPSSTPINRNKRIFRDVKTLILTLFGDFFRFVSMWFCVSFRNPKGLI